MFSQVQFYRTKSQNVWKMANCWTLFLALLSCNHQAPCCQWIETCFYFVGTMLLDDFNLQYYVLPSTRQFWSKQYVAYSNFAQWMVGNLLPTLKLLSRWQALCSCTVMWSEWKTYNRYLHMYLVQTTINFFYSTCTSVNESWQSKNYKIRLLPLVHVTHILPIIIIIMYLILIDLLGACF